MSEENVINEENQNIEETNSSENKSDFAVEDENKVEQKDVKSEPTMEEKYGELNDKHSKFRCIKRHYTYFR